MRLPESVMTCASWGGVALVQVTLVALLGLVCWLLARRGNPALRTAILLATVVGLLFLPALAGLAPTWLPLPQCVCPARTAPTPASPADAGSPSPSLPVADVQLVALQIEPPPAKDMLEPAGPGQKAGEVVVPLAKAEVVFDLTVSPEEVAILKPTGEQPASPWPVAVVLSAVWLLGVLFCLGRSARQLLALYRCSWQAREIHDPEWIDALASLARRDGLPAISLKESPVIASPLILGLFRPVILLPPGRTTWSARERILILEHELAHVRRRDFLAGLAVELVLCLCWFHPLVRWLAARLRLEQEYAADAWVASVADDSRDYIRCLARLALEQNQERRSLAPALWRRRPEILRRIDMLQKTPKGLQTRLSKSMTALVTIMAAAACLAVASVGPLSPDATAAKPLETESNVRSKEDSLGDPLPAGVLARLGTTRLRHQGEVTFVAFVPGGKLLTAGKDNSIRLWDLEKRKEVRSFPRPTPVAVKKPANGPKDKARQPNFSAMIWRQGNRGDVFQVALTADGKTLAAAGGNVVQLWDLSTGKELRKIIGPELGLTGLIFSPDGRTLAGRTASGAIHLWSADTGKEIHHIKPTPRLGQRELAFIFGGGGGGLSPTPGMSFTPDSKTLVAAMKDYQKDKPIRSIKFFDIASGKETRKIDVPGNAGLSSVAVTQDSKLLAYGAGNIVHVCAADTAKEIHKITAADGVHMLVFSPDGKTLAVRGLNQRIRLWDTNTGKELHQLNDAERPRRTGGFILVSNDDFGGPEWRAVDISPDGKRIASAAGATIRLWETATGKEVSLVDSHWRAPSAIVLSADGKTVVTWGGDRVVRRWQSATGKSLGAFPAPPRTTLAVFSADGRTVALANADKSIRLHDTTTGKERSRLKGPDNGVFAMAFAPGGKVLAARGNGDNTIRLYDLARKEEIRQLVIRPKNAQPRGTFIVFGGSAGGPSGTGPGLVFSPDGKLAATPMGGDGGRSKTIVFFDTATGKELRKIESPEPIASFTFSPDSRTVATENANGTIALWEVASGKQRGQLGQAPEKKPAGNGGRMVIQANIDVGLSTSGAVGGPVGVSFSPDGRALAVIAADRSVLLWDVAAGKEIGKLQGHRGGLQTVLFSPNGKTLASGSNDTTVLLWDAADALKDLARPQSVELTGAEISSLWGDLAGTDAIKAHQGVDKLAVGGKQVMPFLDKHLKPALRVEVKKINGWIADLENEKFSVRREAATRLLKVGVQAVPPLKKLLASGPTLEMRKRAEELVDRLTSGELTTEQLRIVRAVETLERIGTPEARRLLKTLADGGPGELPTREAQAALDRLAASKR